MVSHNDLLVGTVSVVGLEFGARPMAGYQRRVMEPSAPSRLLAGRSHRKHPGFSDSGDNGPDLLHGALCDHI